MAASIQPAKIERLKGTAIKMGVLLYSQAENERRETIFMVSTVLEDTLRRNYAYALVNTRE